MTVLESAIDTAAAGFAANAAAMGALVSELRGVVDKIRQGGGEAARARHVSRGKLLPRDRIRALIDPVSPFLVTPKMEGAPALVQGLVMAREELLLLVLTWSAMIGVAVAHHLATAEAALWCAVLLTQSLPYLAAVTVAVIAAFPASVRQPRALTANAGALLAAGD